MEVTRNRPETATLAVDAADVRRASVSLEQQVGGLVAPERHGQRAPAVAPPAGLPTQRAGHEPPVTIRAERASEQAAEAA